MMSLSPGRRKRAVSFWLATMSGNLSVCLIFNWKIGRCREVPSGRSPRPRERPERRPASQSPVRRCRSAVQGVWLPRIPVPTRSSIARQRGLPPDGFRLTIARSRGTSRGRAPARPREPGRTPARASPAARARATDRKTTYRGAARASSPGPASAPRRRAASP